MKTINYTFVVFVGFFFTQIFLFASEIETATTNDFHFYRDGSGCMTITVSASNIYSIGSVFGLSKDYLAKNSLDYYLRPAIIKSGFKELSTSLKTNATSVMYVYTCSFRDPQSVLNWLDDNISISDKYFKWRKHEVDVHIRLSEEYQAGTTFGFRFDGYKIRNANGLILDAQTILWRPDESNGIKTLHLRAEN
jgi:hypothetical protein